jgi:ABC-type phosphate transport system substrate-binding protein
MRAPLPLLLGLLVFATAPAVADPVVVVSARGDVQRLDREDVVNIFLGRYRRFPDGSTARPVDQPEFSPTKAAFYRKLVNKDLNEINAYWARLVFSGKTPPPARVASAEEVATFILATPGGIGYLARDQVDARFRIVLELPR